MFRLSKPVLSQLRQKSIRVGCGSGFWGDSRLSTRQLVEKGDLDYLVYDYLSEITMSLMVGARMRKPDMGYAPDIVPSLQPHFAQLQERGTKVVCNAGGVNPTGCAEAMAKAAEKAGFPDLKIAAIGGDQVFQDGFMTSNAYFGCESVVEALKKGADIVLTGRLTDSALILGPAAYEFGWKMNDWDKLAAGSCAGHIVECGAQCSGGNHTDWQDVAESWYDVGFPIAIIDESGDFEITKPVGTGGKVSVETVAEQLTYEVGNPAAYLLPDVTANFSEANIQQLGPDRVKVTGITGVRPTDTLKLGRTKFAGYRAMMQFYVGGQDCQAKAHAVANALIKRIENELVRRELGEFTRKTIHTTPPLGVEGATECFLRAVVRHDDKDALKFFGLEVATAGTSMAPGLQAGVGGRPKASPVLEYESVLIPKTEVIPTLTIGDEEIEIPNYADYEPLVDIPQPAAQPNATEIGPFSYTVHDLALTRSGDKGNSCNVSVIARKPEYLPYLRRHLTEEKIFEFFRHKFPQDATAELVTRYDWPGINGLNFVLEQSLGGGGLASDTTDPQGKAFASTLNIMEIPNLPHITKL